jgi:hypothetical protein
MSPDNSEPPQAESDEDRLRRRISQLQNEEARRRINDIVAERDAHLEALRRQQEAEFQKNVDNRITMLRNEERLQPRPPDAERLPRTEAQLEVDAVRKQRSHDASVLAEARTRRGQAIEAQLQEAEQTQQRPSEGDAPDRSGGGGGGAQHRAGQARPAGHYEPLKQEQSERQSAVQSPDDRTASDAEYWRRRREQEQQQEQEQSQRC